ncbi:MAG: tripartite tricarboxylate transporter substrate binding protein [Pigmentiphaga sp.]|nr:tripartite tricarboxylate transporter substrate binding protein [Pigmentiphaga sp.]
MRTSSAIPSLFVAALVGLAPAAQADDFPSRPISIVVPFGAGSGSDITARFYAQALKETLGATGVVQLKPGAAGMIGALSVARAAPDGYTILVGSGTVNAANYALYRDQIEYSPQDFDTVATLMVTPPVLLANDKLPGATIDEILQQAKDSGTQLDCGSGNAVTQVACDLLGAKTGVPMVNIPYKGNAQTLTDLSSGQITLAFSDMAAAAPFVARGQARPVAVPMIGRLPTLPNVPTFEEQGIEDFEFLSWGALFVPAGTPQHIIEKLNAAARHMLASPSWEQQRKLGAGLLIDGDLETSATFVRDEQVRWERYGQQSGIKGSM